MKLINHIVIVTLCNSCFFTVMSQAQQLDTISENIKKDNPFPLFYEKVYLHLDREYYASGDDIWFKAYLVSGKSNWLNNTSKNLYVELISPESELITREVIYLKNGTGAGDFKLDSSIPDGTYRIRAYTNWMRNFGDCFIFEKRIEIYRPNEFKVKVANQSSGKKKSKAMELPFDTTKDEIRFFPEGGSLIDGADCNVAFKAIDLTGKGCNVQGAVVSSNGDTVCSFKSVHLGMGSFCFVPISGEKYHAVGILRGKIPFNTKLPEALPKGFAMRVVNNDNTSLTIYIITNQQTVAEYKDIILTSQSAGITCFTNKIKITNEQTIVKVPKAYFPGGIASLTLYDSIQRPHCERLVYIDRKENAIISITPDKPVYKPREEIVLKVKATDRQNRPVMANLSLSVVNSDLVPEGINNIISYLMLESEVKGTIEQPKMYFDTANAKRYRQLDLLLLTQGWRDFVWRRIADTTFIINYLPEKNIVISGWVRQLFVNKPIVNTQVFMHLKGNKTNMTTFTITDSTGKYSFPGIEFYGQTKLVLISKNKKNKNGGMVLMDPLFKRPIPVGFQPNYSMDILSELKQFGAEI